MNKSEAPTYANAVVFSEKAWAVARHASTEGYDAWFPDPGAWAKRTPLTTEELFAWTDDWVELVPRYSYDNDPRWKD